MYCGTKILTLTSFILGAVSVGTLSLSVATDSWLFMIDPLTRKVDNITLTIQVTTHSGLWKVCSLLGDYELSNSRRCSSVPFAFDEEDDDKGMRIQGQETSMAILRNNRVSVFFPVVSLVLLVVATVLGIMGNIKEDVKTLLAAVAYITGALLLAIGIILYISAINDEVGHRMKSSASEDPKALNSFRYWYGWSFFFAGTAFINSMLTAVVLVTLYLKRNNKQEDMIKIIPGLEDVLDSECKTEQGSLNPTVIL